MKKSIKNISSIKLGEKFLFRFIALFLSIILWLVVTYSINPNYQKEFTSLEISYENMEGFDDKYTIMNDIDRKVDVTIRGKRNDVIALDYSDVRPYIDFTGVDQNTKTLDVNVKPLHSKFSILSVSNPSIEVDIDKNIRKKVKIIIHQIGETGDKNWVEFIPKTEFVEVSGAKSEVEKIEEVAAIVDVADVKDGNTYNYVLELVSKNPEQGTPDVSISQKDVDITTVMYTEKKVGIVPVFEGKPSGDFGVVKYEAKPDKVMLTGPVKVLEKMENILSKPVDVSVYNEIKTVVLPLSFEEDIVDMMGGNQTVNLEMFFDKKVEKVLKFNTKDIKIENIPEGKLVKALYPEELEFDISGYSDKVESLEPKDLYVTIDIPDNFDGSKELFYSYGIKNTSSSEHVSVKKHEADTKVKLEMVDE